MNRVTILNLRHCFVNEKSCICNRTTVSQQSLLVFMSYYWDSLLWEGLVALSWTCRVSAGCPASQVPQICALSCLLRQTSLICLWTSAQILSRVLVFSDHQYSKCFGFCPQAGRSKVEGPDSKGSVTFRFEALGAARKALPNISDTCSGAGPIRALKVISKILESVLMHRAARTGLM